jgi:hypothetical protein
MTPWIDTEKIRVGPIGPEERKALDTQLVRLLVQHRIVAAGKLHAVPQPKRTGNAGRKHTPSPEHVARLKAYNAARSAAARFRKEADNVADQVEVRFLEAYAAGTAVTERVASACAGDIAPGETRSQLPAQGSHGNCPPGEWYAGGY